VKAVTLGAVIVKGALALEAPNVALMFAVAAVPTGVVATAAVPVVAPAASVIVAGTVAEALSEDIATDKPPAGAGPLIVTVAVLPTPPRTEVGLSATVVTEGGLIVRVALADPAPCDAVMTAETLDTTAVVVTVKVPVVAPAPTVTVAGTVAAALPEVKLTITPPAGAGAASVTVPADELPPRTLVGFKDTLVTPAAVIVKVAFAEVPFDEAVMEAVWVLDTAAVVTVNVPVVAPAAIVAVPGTVAAALLEDNATERPPAGAAELIVIVPVELTPPTTEVGLSERPVTFGPWTTNGAVADVPFAVAVIVAVPVVLTATVVTVNVAVVAPAATVTVAGTVAPARFDESVIGSPPAGAGLEMVTVPVEFVPPSTVVGLSERVVTVGALTFRGPVTLVVPSVAPIFATTLVVIPDVVTLNVAVLEPAGTVTEPGTWAAALSELRVTVSPPDGAWPVRVTVPTEPCPPRTLWGLSVTVIGMAGITGNAHLNVAPKAVTVRFAVTLLVTGTDVIANVPVVAPDGTRTVAGTVTKAVKSELAATEKPAGGAAELSVSVPVIVPPPYPGLGATEKPVKAIGLIVKAAFADVAFAAAVIVAVTLVAPC